jgi:hypothetical protein
VRVNQKQKKKIMNNYSAETTVVLTKHFNIFVLHPKPVVARCNPPDTYSWYLHFPVKDNGNFVSL